MPNLQQRLSKTENPNCQHAFSTAISLLLNLETAQRGRSVLFSVEQKLLFKGGKKGFVKNAKIGFYEMLTKPIMKAP
jgi:hypothetical protein